MRVMAAEIEELKESLRYAEYMLAKTLQEKEHVSEQRADMHVSLEQMGAQMRVRDQESIEKEMMFRDL